MRRWLKRGRVIPDGIVVVGAGFAGSMTALALARSGHRVTVLERDDLPTPADADEAFASPRPGTPQALHTHGFLARLLVLLRDRYPDVLADLEATGATTLFLTDLLGDPEPGDDDLRVLVARRSTVEWVLRRKVRSEPNVTIRPCAPVTGLVARRNDRDGRPIVTGVRLESGEEVLGEAVVVATGLHSMIASWLGAIGVECPEEVHECGYVYLTRWYRRLGAAADDRPRLFGNLPYLKVLGVPGDGATLSITLAVPSADRALRQALTDSDRFDLACRQIPALEHYFRGDAPAIEPLGPVRPMAGLINRARRYTDAHGAPTALGLHVVGDAHTTTNPLYGRGCSLAAVQAVLLADAFAAHPGDALARGAAYEAASATEVEPWYQNAVQMQALEEGRGDALPPSEHGAAAQLAGAIFVLGGDDPMLGRAMARHVNLLERPLDALADGELVARVTELASRPGALEMPPPDGPSRDELLGLLADGGAAVRASEPPAPHATQTERTVRVADVELRVLEAGPPDGPAVVLVHGFPDLAYSWRHQIPALADAGWRVLAPDQRGYGGSSRPAAVEDYDIHHLTGDLVALLDDAGIDRATFVGHDWGAMVVGNVVLLHPDRVSAAVALSVPFVPRGPKSLLRALEDLAGDSFLYLRWFQEPGVADDDFGRDPAETMLRVLAGPVAAGDTGATPSETTGFVASMPRPTALPAWLSQAELDHYVAAFRRTGFTGGLNWYRNLERNWQTTEHLDGVSIGVPTAFIVGGDDPVQHLLPASLMDGHVTDHRFSAVVPAAGHWVHQERPAEVNALLLRFVADVDATRPVAGGLV